MLKILQFKKRNAKTNEFEEFEVLKLQDLHMFNICCLVHKVINKREILPQAINTLFTQSSHVHDYDTKQKKELHPIILIQEVLERRQFHIKAELFGINSRKTLKTKNQ